MAENSKIEWTDIACLWYRPSYGSDIRRRNKNSRQEDRRYSCGIQTVARQRQKMVRKLPSMAVAKCIRQRHIALGWNGSGLSRIKAGQAARRLYSETTTIRKGQIIRTCARRRQKTSARTGELFCRMRITAPSKFITVCGLWPYLWREAESAP